MVLNYVNEEHQKDILNKLNREKGDRVSVAECFVFLNDALIMALTKDPTLLSDVFNTASLNAKQITKRSGEFMIFGYSKELDGIDVHITIEDNAIKIVSNVYAKAKTDVDMEALIACSSCALTIYEHLKEIDKNIVIGGIKLLDSISNHGEYHR